MDLVTLAAFATVISAFIGIFALLIGQRGLVDLLHDFVAVMRGQPTRPGRVRQQNGNLEPLLAAAGALGKIYELNRQVESLNSQLAEYHAQLLELRARFTETPTPPIPAASSDVRLSLESAIAGKQNQIEVTQQQITFRFIPPLSSRIGLVDRDRELEAIREAISMVPEPCVLYFVGPGGVGKTRLLEEVANLQGRVKVPFLWSGIIDLYHSDYHSRIGLQESVIRALDPSGKYFGVYNAARDRLAERRSVGMTGALLEQQAETLDELFIEDYNTLAEHSRLVLAFDTIEAFEYESDPVQEICRIEEEGAGTRSWLISQIPKLKNTVVLLAGRPVGKLTGYFERQLAKAKVVYQEFHITGLTEAETEEYFNALTAQQASRTGMRVEPLSPELRKRLWRITEGRPIRLALAFDLSLRGRVENLFTASTPQFETFETDEFLVHEILETDKLTKRLLFYLALARKGLDPELLHYLEPAWTIEECNKHLSEMEDLSFTKRRPDTEALFLHDELYELFDRYSPLRTQEETGEILGKILAYYRAKVSSLQQRLENTQDARERQKVLNDLQAWQIRLLYYELEADPWRGFEENYEIWSDQALRTYEADFDLQLRDELWRFVNRARRQLPVLDTLLTKTIERDAAIRWIWRYLARGNNSQAQITAETILDSHSPLLENIDPRFQAELLVAYGESLVYTQDQESPKIPEALNKAIQLLTAGSPTKDLGPSIQPARYIPILARAYNNLGYAYSNSWRYRDAENLLRTAIDHYDRINVRDEKAFSQNNLAYTLALLGKGSEGEQLSLQALDHWQKTGRRYPAALTQNALGLIRLMASQLTQAQADCERALTVFEELEQGLESQRGIGLACNALGKVLRGRGNEWREANPLECLDYYRRAENFQRRAIQTLNGVDGYYYSDSRNELGCVYRDWARLMQAHGHSIQAERLFANAVRELEGTIAEAKDSWRILRADSYEDLARVHYYEGRIGQAQLALSNAERLVPNGYRIVLGHGMPQISKPIEGYWFLLGKIQLMHGHIALASLDQEKDPERQIKTAAEAYAASVGYFLKFSSYANLFSKVQDEIDDFVQVYAPQHTQLLLTKMQEFAQAYQLDLDPVMGSLHGRLNPR